MKIKNVMFSGFAAAIFATVCGAASAAADVSLISKDYADAKLQAKLVAEGKVTISEDNKIDVDLSDLATKEEVNKKLTGSAINGKAVSFNEQTGVYTITDNNTEYTGEGYVSVADNKITVTADGQVAEGNTGLVKGGTVYDVTSALDTRVQTAESDIDALQADVGSVPEAGWSIGNETATNIADAVRALNNKTASSEDVSNIKAVVGDMSDGLVKDVADLQTTVGDENSGLVKDVADLKTDMGDVYTKGQVDTALQNKQNTLTAANVVSGSDNVSVKFANGVYTISATDNNTTYNVGTAQTEGLTKLYGAEGEATDGTMTQAAIKTALAGKADSGDLDVLATKDEVAMKVSNIKQPGTYLVNFTETGAVSYAPIQILGANGQPVSLTTGAVQPQ